MQVDERHRELMLMALEASRRALPHCRPNPPVGCVLVRNDQVIATGFTQPPGDHHAEANALSMVDGSLSDVSVYVTLEPCSFHGRTPSCARALIDNNVKEVHVAMLDPHPKNNGEGIKLLRDAGITVSLGIAEEEVSSFLAPYLIRTIETSIQEFGGRPESQHNDR